MDAGKKRTLAAIWKHYVGRQIGDVVFFAKGRHHAKRYYLNKAGDVGKDGSGLLIGKSIPEAECTRLPECTI